MALVSITASESSDQCVVEMCFVSFDLLIKSETFTIIFLLVKGAYLFWILLLNNRDRPIKL